jgi:hypothetical protein
MILEEQFVRSLNKELTQLFEGRLFKELFGMPPNRNHFAV